MNLEDNFSQKQIALIYYLLKRLGFEEGDFLDVYIEHLLYNAGNYSIYKAITPSQYPVDHTKPPKDYYYYHRGLEIWLPAYSIINFLSDEVEMKKRKKVVWKEIDTKNSQLKISASDISSYLFCPVSYIIKKSIVPDPTINSLLGDKLHNKNILIEKSKRISEDYNTPTDYDENREKENNINKVFFNDIKKSHLKYSGHREEDKDKYFYNAKKTFIGQPDYVFQNEDNQNFIVEEKFVYKRKGEPPPPFRNSHIGQLASYIHGLADFNAEYGYLVYWLYDHNLEIISLQIKKIHRKELKYKRLINNTYLKIKAIHTNKTISFSSDKLYPKKCAKCSLCRYCGHKTGKYNDIKFPYHKMYYNLDYAPFPEILKRKNTSQNNVNDTVKYENIDKHISPQDQKDILNNLNW